MSISNIPPVFQHPINSLLRSTAIGTLTIISNKMYRTDRELSTIRERLILTSINGGDIRREHNTYLAQHKFTMFVAVTAFACDAGARLLKLPAISMRETASTLNTIADWMLPLSVVSSAREVYHMNQLVSRMDREMRRVN